MRYIFIFLFKNENKQALLPPARERALPRGRVPEQWPTAARRRHLKDRLAQADSRDLEQQGKIRELLEQLDGLRGSLRSSQDAAHAARERIGFVEGEAALARENARAREGELRREVAALASQLSAAELAAAKEATELKGRLDHESSVARMERDRAGEHLSELERTAHNLRFEQDLRAEKERHLSDHKQKIAEHEIGHGRLQERLGEALSKYEREVERVKSLEAAARLREREADKLLADTVAKARAAEDTLKIQLRAANELAEARRERSAHDQAVRVQRQKSARRAQGGEGGEASQHRAPVCV